MKTALAALLLAALLGCARSEAPLTILQAPSPGERWRVINYWASWCAPCREEIPELNTLFHRGLVDVYAVNFDAVQGDTLIEQALELDIQFPLLAVDPGPALGAQRPTALPTTLIVSPRGELVARLLGEQTVRSIEAELSRLAGEASLQKGADLKAPEAVAPGAPVSEGELQSPTNADEQD